MRCAPPWPSTTRSFGASGEPMDNHVVADAMAAISSRLPDADFRAAVEIGRRLRLDQIVALVERLADAAAPERKGAA